MRTYPPLDSRHQPDNPHQEAPAAHVVFGTGPIGLAVIDHLVELGINVRAVNRSGVATERRERSVRSWPPSSSSGSSVATANADSSTPASQF